MTGYVRPQFVSILITYLEEKSALDRFAERVVRRLLVSSAKQNRIYQGNVTCWHCKKCKLRNDLKCEF